MTELTEDILDKVVAENPQVLVQYGATWCGNCRLIKPKFKRLSGTHEDIVFVYVDAEKLPNSRALATVNNLPTFAAFKNGTLVGQKAGNKEEIIKNLIDEIANH